MKATKAQKVIKEIEELFNEKQIEVIKSTIKHGGWGSTDVENELGETIGAYGYITSDAKKGLKDFTNRQISGVYSGISKLIKKSKISFMVHIPDYWGEGNSSEGMLLIDYSINREIEEWARKMSITPSKKIHHEVGDIHKNGLWYWTEYKPGKFDWRTIKVK